MTKTSLEFEQRHRLQRALEEAELTPADMADALDVHRNTVSNYLHGRSRPTYLVLKEWARVCDVSYAWLTYGHDESAGDGPVPDNKSFRGRRHLGPPETHSYPEYLTYRRQVKPRLSNRRLRLDIPLKAQLDRAHARRSSGSTRKGTTT